MPCLDFVFLSFVFYIFIIIIAFFLSLCDCFEIELFIIAVKIMRLPVSGLFIRMIIMTLQRYDSKQGSQERRRRKKKIKQRMKQSISYRLP